MENNNTIIDSMRTKYPQIYAYTLPTIKNDIGWIKIGYTERKNVDERIKEQTKTAAIDLPYDKLWSAPSKFFDSDDFFTDKDFHKYLRNYKGVEQRQNREWFYYNGTPEKSYADFDDFRKRKYNQSKNKFSYELRSEQLEAVTKTLEYAKNNIEGEFLWNAKPRFGKTLAAYDFVRQQNANNVLIVTNRPSIGNSWFDDFEKFISWQTDYRFVSTSDSLKNRPVLSREEFLNDINSNDNVRQISFISLQDLKGSVYFGGNYNKLKWVKDLKWDILIVDESHEGRDTLKTDIAFNQITRKFTLNLSGTPFKAIASGRFSKNQIYNWSYYDEQKRKNDWSKELEFNPYERLPRLNMFSYQMSQMITDEVNKGAEIDGSNIDYAFDLNEFFETNESGKFVYESDVKKWLDSLTNNEKYPFSTKKLRNEIRHSFWLLNRVASAKALKRLLENHPVFENYKIILAAGNGKANENDQIINEKSLSRVRKAIKTNNKTITISVGQLTTGVTVPEWTAVMMLSNIKSPSLYMQAAFRVQNPWTYESESEIYEKKNAYVFDFAPARTLIIYDEFANNLSSNSKSKNTTDDRVINIKNLLNFFPVISEDSEGKMVELDASQVLTIPKAIKSQEVVRRGFMSNLLFQNISRIFASEGAREIIEKLVSVEQGKVSSRGTGGPIDTKNISVNDSGSLIIESEDIDEVSNANFGSKVYEDIEFSTDISDSNIPDKVATLFKNNTQNIIENLAKEKGVHNIEAQKIVKQNYGVISRNVELIQKQANINKAEAKEEFEKDLAESYGSNEAKLNHVKAAFEEKQQQIQSQFEQDVSMIYQNQVQELTKKSSEEILRKSKNNDKKEVEDKVRSHLRGFTRTIPSFLMAYGQNNTTLQSFDKDIKENVFEEVTGITLDQFRTLRDMYDFFDADVFNESVAKFMAKRKELSNYFDTGQDEDIFDYIPPQQTNQIFTPKKVVKLMVDKLQQESPENFTNPDKKFADLYMKSGMYIAEIVKRLYVGLSDSIPDDDERLKYILEHQVYGFAPSEIIYNIARNFIFGFDEKAKRIDSSHIVQLDTTPFACGEGDFESKCDELFGGR